MIVKKLAVPLINEKILQETTHCYIATSSISEAGFDFIRSRISSKVHIDIVTSLDELVSPLVMQRILQHYQGRINLNIYTRNTLHANVYIFDLPFRKSVAFVGSGSLTTEGIKDNEELFWKITEPKAVESLMSWYTSYFQFGTPLSEQIAKDYSELYPAMKMRDVYSRQDKEQVMQYSISSSFLATAKFRNQFFEKDDFLCFSPDSIRTDNAALRLKRMNVQNKLEELKKLLATERSAVNFQLSDSNIYSSLELSDHPGNSIRTLAIALRGSGSEIEYHTGVSVEGFFVAARWQSPDVHRQALWLRDKLETESVRTNFFNALVSLGKGFTIQAAGVRKPLESFPNVQALFDFIKSDELKQFPVSVEKVFRPGDPDIAKDKIAITITSLLKSFESVHSVLMNPTL